jgi:PPOX class probable F420-dependent enzyme
MPLDATVRSFLEEQRFAVLATINDDGTPQQTVMWYALQGDTVMMNTKFSRVKHTNLLRDQRISICVADAYRYVTIAGVARLDDNQSVAQTDIRALAIRYHGQEKGDQQAAEKFVREQRISIYLPLTHVIAKDL